ncbi:MAG: hypothetical protein CFE45_13975, partial [Burkholderiales bacterium PBB5]
KANLKAALTSLCANNLVEYTDGTSNVSTYFCTSSPVGTAYATATAVKFTGTAYSEVRLNVNGGSFTAACLLANWPAGTKCPTADLYWDPAAAAMAAAPAGSVVLGGLMDVEPNGFLADVRTGISAPASNISAGFAQTFGVAVSPALYNAMFADQQAAGKLPASCLVSDTAKAECVPVIGKPQMAAIMSANTFNAAYANGANFLAPSLAAGTPLTYARRVDTSGTQAAAQQYFLGNVCNGNAVGVVPEGGSAGAITVTALATTGNVRTLLNNTSNYVIGVISAENNQSGQAWRWVRVGGTAVAESAAPNESGVSFTNTASAKDGTYDFWFVSRVVKPNVAAVTTFWTAVTKALNTNITAAASKGLFAMSETKFSKGTSSSCTPVAQ